VNVGGPDPARPDRDARGVAMSMPRPQPVRTVAVRQSSNLNTLEATTPGLQRALLLLAIAPITQHYLDVAAAYRQAGVWDKAFDFLTEGLRHEPADASLHDGLARAWRDWGFPDLGLTAAHRAVYHAPRSPEARNTLGTLLWALGQRADARRAFEQSAALDPQAAYAWHNLCRAAMAAGQTREATSHCQRAAALARKRRGEGPR
jgi:Tfp pilus assembly protein PilF